MARTRADDGTGPEDRRRLSAAARAPNAGDRPADAADLYEKAVAAADAAGAASA